MMRRALVFQHMDHDHPGRFIDFLAEDDISLEPVRLFAGQPIPSLGGYDLLFVLGGAQDCWQEDQYPWLVEEKAAIREWVLDRAKPYIGVCLGHQLLAAALGGEVAKSNESEVGIFDVNSTGATQGHVFLAGVPSSFSVMQWHFAEVKKLPVEAQVLKASPRAAVQCLAIGTHALSTQFHCEFTLQTIASWSSLPNYRAALDTHMGERGLERFARQAMPLMPEMHRITRRIYENFAQASGLRASWR